jgi:hypothetical protein
MKHISTEVLLENLATYIDKEKNYKWNKGRRLITADKRRIEYELISRGLERWSIYEKAEEILTELDTDVVDDDWIMPSRKNLKSRIMYIENKGDDGILGSGRIGRVYFSKSGKSLYYNNRRFQSLKGSGFKSNYFDVDSGEHYWISGFKKNQSDKLYGGNKGVTIDEDVRDEYLAIIQSQ